VASTADKKKLNGADFGFEAKLFQEADKLRGNMKPSDYRGRKWM